MPPKARASVKTKVTIKDNGFNRLYEELGGLGCIRMGIQEEDAKRPHSMAKGLTIGDLATMHEYGIGVPRRSWLNDWMTANTKRMADDALKAMQSIITRKESRKAVLEKIGREWTGDMRDNILRGGVRPGLAMATIKRKGHAIPLLETGDIMNNIKFKLSLTHIKSIKDIKVREAVRLGPIKT